MFIMKRGRFLATRQGFSDDSSSLDCKTLSCKIKKEEYFLLEVGSTRVVCPSQSSCEAEGRKAYLLLFILIVIGPLLKNKSYYLRGCSRIRY